MEYRVVVFNDTFIDTDRDTVPTAKLIDNQYIIF